MILEALYQYNIINWFHTDKWSYPGVTETVNGRRANVIICTHKNSFPYVFVHTVIPCCFSWSWSIWLTMFEYPCLFFFISRHTCISKLNNLPLCGETTPVQAAFLKLKIKAGKVMTTKTREDLKGVRTVFNASSIRYLPVLLHVAVLYEKNIPSNISVLTSLSYTPRYFLFL